MLCFPGVHIGLLSVGKIGGKLLFLFGDSFGCISFLIISYVFTYILLKHLEAFGNGCPGIKKKIKAKLKNPSGMRIAAFRMQILSRLKASLSLITPLTLTPSPSPSAAGHLQTGVPTHPLPLSSRQGGSCCPHTSQTCPTAPV